LIALPFFNRIFRPAVFPDGNGLSAMVYPSGWFS